MTTCWKCGAETPNHDSECDACAAGISGGDAPSPVNRERLESILNARQFEIDWDKLQSWEEFRELAKILWPSLIVGNQTSFEAVKKWLKENS